LADDAGHCADPVPLSPLEARNVIPVCPAGVEKSRS
jgi:hypothetical protein